MLLRPFLNDATSCASYLFGCGTHAKLAVVDPHADLVDEYIATAAGLGAAIVAVFETHVQADHVSGASAQRPIFRPARESSSSTSRSPTATSWSSVTRS
jgi:glyoxylase-like metal-dependent hydrolase (beta-lactamase superfamily II)